MPALKDRLIEENLGLVRMAARKYRGFGVEDEDLIQIGSMGLIKAARDFDPQREIKFSTYAVAKIIGEIKTYLRDHSEIKVSRKYKENKIKIDRAQKELEQKLGREPKISEIAEKTGLSSEEIISSLEAVQPTISLDLPPEEGGITAKTESTEDLSIDRVVARQMLSTLPPKERSLLVLRFFKEETQSKTAEILGLTQVAVCRLERKIIKDLREKYNK